MKYDFSDLMTFLAIAEEAGVTAAAKILGVSKSTVSNRLARLEGLLGVKLVQRSTRRLRLTEAGQRLLVHCERMKAELNDASLSMEDFRRSVSGKITITSPTASGHVFLPGLLNAFRAQHSAIDFAVTLTDQETDLIGGGVDVAFRTGVQRDSSLIVRPLMDFSIKIYAPTALAHDQDLPSKPQDLARFDCLHHPSIPVWQLRRGTETYAFRPAQNISAGNHTFLRRMLMGSRSLAALPSYLVEEDVAAGRIFCVLPQWTVQTMPYALVYPSKQQPSQAISKFIEFTVQYFRRGQVPAEG